MRFNPALLLVLLLFSGCGWQMAEQPRLDPYEANTLMADGSSAQKAPSGTVSRSAPEERPALTKELLERGRERYNIACAVCHGERGNANGPVISHGFPVPPSFHIARLRQADDLIFWSAISNGAGRMYPYSDRVAPRDRWAIIEWIRVLQLAEDASLEEMPPDLRRRALEELKGEQGS